jgi:hypothetical protein
MKTLKEYPYIFSFQDKWGNEYESKIYKCFSKREAINLAHNLLGNLSHGDIVKIKTKKSWQEK